MGHLLEMEIRHYYGGKRKKGQENKKHLKRMRQEKGGKHKDRKKGGLRGRQTGCQRGCRRG